MCTELLRRVFVGVCSCYVSAAAIHSPKPRFLAIEQAKDEASPDQEEWLNRAKPCLAPKARL